MAFLFEKLAVYQKSLALSIQISKLTDGFPRGHYYLTDQLNRAALSIPANLAEGNGRWHAAERRQFFWIARGSALECVPLIDVAFQKELILRESYEELRKTLDEIGGMITNLIKGTDRRGNDGIVQKQPGCRPRET